ncbi:hypothetical protein A3A93_05465 [Candidatus Roizmanbacteria bacterium RIFCSPLOWO2_01_FULL_38_12]|uniref:Alpha/beta hydrolase n=1 Tax=Candidatus Roizmanbacteria bacterium RIFCSPLOWO2_01_FULL_38_12 TaxID=1802061 RepID=A0A1F7IZ79_9BACT|nr:MAG: hypothetical protein A2861_03680 [Candidatus Roizmanbacteria bacterium RIFCSPHIGHO2_01_FULL_38_15]OGK35254.1 MAG: hypothetical protein A3F59_06345 [Candidatus Roizmanbacteria bacterium RIFCSPHIGHO2_12_FULL_38_13]OGK48635.1 MAG: hypothetical protein A3A93_05465 [Candidatus Roizmanbacteria bacterium RIFCSPLOWO2_01_FULL_38_12]
MSKSAQKRAIIVHGWDGYPQEGWFPWAKKQLEKLKYEVSVPAMPSANEPKIETWVETLSDLVGIPNKETLFIGHSIGCQTILRYLESLPEGTQVNKVILVAPWMHLSEKAMQDEETRSIAAPWIDRPIDFTRVRERASKFVCIFSDDDDWVPLSDGEIFREMLGAKIMIERGKGHFSGEDGITELPVLLDKIIEH